MTTTEIRRVATKCSSRDAFRVPLTITDMHLRHEQLPFCYYFEETLDQDLLEESLAETLRQFPEVGGKICHETFLAISCSTNDSVQLSFGTMDKDISLLEWRALAYGHCHSSGGPQKFPELLPLFDPLFQNERNSKDSSESQSTDLAKVRVTYFEKGGGTAIGVNFNHVLGDTSSCVTFVREWGRSMRRRQAKVTSASTSTWTYDNDRSMASCSGMMTPIHVDLMGLHEEYVNTLDAKTWNQDTGLSTNIMPTFLQNLWAPASSISGLETESATISQEHFHVDPILSSAVNHEYVRLNFSPDLLQSIKTFGMSQFLPSVESSRDENAIPQSPSSMLLPFVSTNDMVTAFGWLMKRFLSQKLSYNLSMVINLRGHADIHKDMFGNGITNIVVEHAPSTEKPTTSCNPSVISLLDINHAAVSIRKALLEGVNDLPDRLLQSRLGRVIPRVTSTQPTFSTTSWRQFPLERIRFTTKNVLLDFHGHPAHPLPLGETYASVIRPCVATNGVGCTYELLLPSDKAEEARSMHQALLKLYMEERISPINK